MSIAAARPQPPKMDNPMMQNGQQHSPSQLLPSISALTNGLPPTSQPSQPPSSNQQSQTMPSRDSGTWPHPQSKHSSLGAASLQVSTLLNPDDSQTRNSVPSTPTSVRHSQHNPTLPSINQGFETNGGHRGSGDYYPQMESRRSSIDSRMHNGFNNLAINNPASPYESQNGSQISLAASLRRPNGQGSQMSPLSGRTSLRAQHPHPPRIAPPIVPNARIAGAPDPTASKPTQGFPWAFPDETIPEERQRRESSSGDSSLSHTVSRQNSFAASSIRSSIFSVDGLPAGQRRFDDADPNTTHHHSMQHRAVSSLQQNDMTPIGGTGNYSRTPELRVSHKLAERKRRSEMKDLFEDLNKAVPSNGGAKASKWEILSKAIEHIRSIQMNERSLHGEVSRLRQESEYARESQKENELLRTEVHVMHERMRRLDPSQPHIYGQYTSQLAQQSHANGQPAQMSLPPMSTAVQQPQQYNAMPPPAQMQGVEYGGQVRAGY